MPDGYFEELNVSIMSKLPPYPEAPRSVDMSLWQRIKPYAYLAAMFAGIWLMMNMFHHVSSSATSLSLENPPGGTGGYDRCRRLRHDSGLLGRNDYDLQKDVSVNYDSFDEFEDDFGYELEPEYSAMQVSVSAKDSKKESRSV